MELSSFWDQVLFVFLGLEVSVGTVILAGFFLVSVALANRIVRKRLFPRLFSQVEVAKENKRRLVRQLNLALLLILILGLWVSTGLNYILYSNENFTLSLQKIIGGIIIWQIAHFILVVFDSISFEEYLVGNRVGQSQAISEKSRDVDRNRARRNFRYFIYSLAVLMMVSILDVNYTIGTFQISKNTYTLKISNIISAFLVILMARLLIWVFVRFFLANIYNRQKVDVGSQYAINQLFQYVVYFIALLIVLNVLGVNITVLAGGAAALLLGIGLGLQQTFNDFFSGILLLFERSVEVGDVVQIEGLIGTVRQIGLRTSKVQTRDNISVIVPNSKLVVNSVVNWSHTDKLARFMLGVGVAYGSNTELVKNLLLEAAANHNKVMKFPKPFVRFTNFGNSSLDFELHFWSSDFIRIEDTKSDLRFVIDQSFRDNKVTIPFPQRDVWLKKE